MLIYYSGLKTQILFTVDCDSLHISEMYCIICYY